MHPFSDVPIWLKTLRLHKYTTMFQDLTYDEMMNLNERQLEIRKVTKGARKKILQSLEKLRERVATLKSLDRVCFNTLLENDGINVYLFQFLDEKIDVSIVISEVRAILNTPICTYKPIMTELLDPQTVDGLDVSVDQIAEQVSHSPKLTHALSVPKFSWWDIVYFKTYQNFGVQIAFHFCVAVFWAKTSNYSFLIELNRFFSLNNVCSIFVAQLSLVT